MSAPDWIALGGSAPAVGYVGAWNPTTAYQPGQVVLQNGVYWFAAVSSTGVDPGNSFWPGSIGTSLPSTPTDGMEYTLVDSLTAPTYAWRFKYVAGITGANKWVFVGGSPAYAFVATRETTTSTTYVNLTTNGPQIIVPRTGDYIVRYGCGAFHSVAGQACAIGVAVGDTTPAVDELIFCAANGYTMMLVGEQKLLAVPSGSAIKDRYRTTSATGSFENRWIEVEPVAVA